MEKIKARCILDILGAPKEYIVKQLTEHIQALEDDKGLTVISKEVEEPQEKGKLFTTFAELELEFEKPQALLDFCFDSMPSSVEITAPEQIILPTNELSGLLNDFQAKLHQTETVVNELKTEKALLDMNATNVFRNFIKYALEQKPQTSQELCQIMGVKENQIIPFLTAIEKNGKIIKKGEQWILSNPSKQSSSQAQKD